MKEALEAAINELQEVVNWTQMENVPLRERELISIKQIIVQCRKALEEKEEKQHSAITEEIEED